MSDDEFVREAREGVRRLSGGLVGIERAGDDADVDDLFRTAHGLKGLFAMEGYADAADVAYAVEDLLGAVRRGEIGPDPTTIDHALTATDRLADAVGDVARAGDVREETALAPAAATLREAIRDAGGTVDDSGTGGTDEQAPGPDVGVDADDPDGVGDLGDLDDLGDPDAAGVRINDDLVDAPEPSPDAGPTAEEALASAAEFDDLDALVSEIDDADEFADLDGGGAFPVAGDETGEASPVAGEDAGEASPVAGDETDEATDEPASRRGGVGAPGATLDDEPADPQRAFADLREAYDEADVADLQRDLDDVEFGEFDEDDDLTIDDLLAGDDDEGTDGDLSRWVVDATPAETGSGTRAGTAAPAGADDGFAGTGFKPATSDATTSDAVDADAGETDDEAAALAEVLNVMTGGGADADAPGAGNGPGAGSGSGAADATAEPADAGADDPAPADPDPEPVDADPDPALSGGDDGPVTPDDGATAPPIEELDGVDDVAAYGAGSESESGAGSASDAGGAVDDPEPDAGLDSATAGTAPDRDAGDALDAGVESDAGDDEDDGTQSFARDAGVAAFEERFGDALGIDAGGDADDDGAGAGERPATTVAASAFAGRLPDAGDDGPRLRGRGDDLGALRVDPDVADELLRLTDDIEVARLRLREALSALDVDLPPEAIEEFEALAGRTGELRRSVMDVRLTAVSTVTDRLPRVARDAARTEDKEVAVSVVGDDVKLDRGVVDRIGDPLTHLVRNAVSHGIEPPDERAAAGKPREGTVEVRVDRAGDDVTIEVRDDGAGIDVDDVRRTAVERGVCSSAEAASLSRRAAFDLLFEPGFSTAGAVTGVSGRGVGMDAVRAAVSALDGSVEFKSTPGEGTTVRLELPVTVAMAELLFVDAGAETYAVPTADVEGVATLPGDGPVGRAVADGGRPDPDAPDAPDVVDLRAALDAPPAGDPSRSRPERVGVRVTRDGTPLVLACDRVHGTREAVIDPYDDLLADVPGVGGTTVASDGRIVNVIDIETL